MTSDEVAVRLGLEHVSKYRDCLQSICKGGGGDLWSIVQAGRLSRLGVEKIRCWVAVGYLGCND